jgi:hypothetical protein
MTGHVTQITVTENGTLMLTKPPFGYILGNELLTATFEDHIDNKRDEGKQAVLEVFVTTGRKSARPG